MIRKFHEAKLSGTSVTLWGSGTPMREFLHVDDLADACVFLMNHYEGQEPVNVGTGTDVTIKELAGLIAEAVGFTGEVIWDSTKPDGTPRKLLDVSRLSALGWTAQIPLEAGLQSTYRWYRDALNEPTLA
ncbi:GDP-L-fucose synthase [compost metagenome]